MGGDCTIPTLALELPARILMCRQGASGYNLCCHSRIVGDKSRGCSGLCQGRTTVRCGAVADP
jgi:hypothetical protein